VLVAATGVAIMMTATGSQGIAASGAAYVPGLRPVATDAQVTITPANGAKRSRPDRPIVVSAANGKLRNVTVSNKGRAIKGRLSADGKRWQSLWNLAPSTRYQVTAIANSAAGKTTTTRSAFTTLKPKETISAWWMAPETGEKVGVGMPIILQFDQPVSNKAQVERSLEVRMSKPVEGAWHWADDRQVIFRTREYWQADTEVSVTAHLSGARAGKGVYGTRDLKTKFTVGDSVISTVSAKKHKMTVKKNGETIRKVPISAGNASKRAYTTTNGIHLTMSMEHHVVMDSATVGVPKGHPDYYKLDVYQAVRISNSGEYVHSAPWSVGSQGRANVSHGCVNASPSNAEWFKDMTNRGDVLIVTGTDRELEWNNGWGFWQMSWSKWKKGSAAKMVVNPGAKAPATPSPSPTTSTPAPASSTPAAPSPSPGG
jgi:lipoprotein-anchoring transpeptidase ErfK/SrfK